MCKVYEFVADGNEEVEALTTVDVLRRAGIETVLVSITGTDSFVSSHGIEIKCDAKIEDVDCSDATMLLLPGGLPGSTNLLDCAALREIILKHAAEGKAMGAICAAPLVFGELGLLEGKEATCYPGFEDHLKGAKYNEEAPYVVSGNIITGCGPAATMPYAFAIVEMLKGQAAANALRDGMMHNRVKNFEL